MTSLADGLGGEYPIFALSRSSACPSGRRLTP